MSLIETISADFMTAYKSREMEKKDFLGVLKTEVTKETKTPEDTSVVATIKSMIKSASASNSLTEDELSILETYLPQQMSEDVLAVTINSYINVHGITSQKEMGKVMSHLSSMYKGKYDGKLASTITRELLA